MPFSETIGHGKALDSQDSRSPLAGEGGSVPTQVLMGEGATSKKLPLTQSFRCSTIEPSPARGEGISRNRTARGDAPRCDIHIFTCQTAQRIPAARWRPGCDLVPTSEGWAERRQTHGVRARHSVGRAVT